METHRVTYNIFYAMLNICHYYMVLFAIWHPGNCLHLGLGYPCCLNATSADFSCEKENSTTALQCYAPFLLIQVLKVVSRSRYSGSLLPQIRSWRHEGAVYVAWSQESVDNLPGSCPSTMIRSPKPSWNVTSQFDQDSIRECPRRTAYQWILISPLFNYVLPESLTVFLLFA